MGWVNVGGSASNESSNNNTNQNTSRDMNYTGTQTPIIDPKYQAAYDKAGGNLNANGATADQQTAIDWTRNNLANSPVKAAVTSGNTALAANSNAVGANTGQLQTNQTAYDNQGNALGANNAQYGTQGAALKDYSNYWKNASTAGSYTLGSLSAKAAAGTPGYESYAAPKDVVAAKVNATQGSKYMGDYQSPYTNDVVNTTLANYDQNTKNQLASLRATRGAGSAFGDRANLSDGSYLDQSDLNRGATEAQLRDKAFTTAAGFGMADADRFLTADTTNAVNGLGASEFNNNLLNNRQQFDVGAAYQGDQMRNAAVMGVQGNIAQQTGITQASDKNIGQQTGVTQSKDANLTLQANNLKTQAGLTQQQIDNVVTQDGIDSGKAQALFAAGQITQQQLNQILAAAQTFNGTAASGNQTATGNTTTDSHGNTTKVEGHAGFDPG